MRITLSESGVKSRKASMRPPTRFAFVRADFVRAWHYAGACSEMFTSYECLVKRFLGMLKVIDLQPSNWLGLVHQKLCSSA